MLRRSRDFIDLDRRFRKLETESKREEASLGSYTNEVFESAYLRSGLSWTNLLEQRLAVILGEAGSGKTWEFRHQADLRSHDGGLAFFIPLEGLSSRPISEILDHNKNQEF